MLIKPFERLVRSLAGDRRGNVAIIAALVMPALLGFLGLGAEVASWYSGKRALQNAADSAAIAAATNSTPAGYADEARAVAAKYGFINGLDGVVVGAWNNAACPGGGNDCYRVTITRVQPILLAQLVGFNGETTLGGSPAKRIAATAVAIQANGPREYCVLALAGSGHPEALRSNGAPFADLSGCNVMSNSNATCNGHDLGADIGDAFGTNDGCGKKRNSDVSKVADPYAALASNIPSHDCSASGYGWIPDKKMDPPLRSDNHLHGLEGDSWTDGVKHICGDAQVTTPVFINRPNSVLVVHGGVLDLQNFTIKTQPGSSLTVIFTGPHMVPAGRSSEQPHIPTGTGAFDIEAPTTGTWKGVALYQDPALTSGVDISEAGNSPTWNITGLVYLPKAGVTFSGAVNKSSNGASCFALVVDNLRINGTGSILNHGECAEAGLTLPYSLMPSRGKLVS